MAQQLDNKVIIVTGGGAGIGLGITRACLAGQAQVVVADLNPKVQDTLQDVLDSNRVHYVQTDVSDHSSIANMISTVEKQYGRIDGLVNNAGLTIDGDFLEYALEDLDRLWATNVRSVFLLCQGVARIMRRQGSGSIVNISSNQSEASLRDYEMYAATKGGVAAMTRSMSWSIGQYGIRVNALSPGLTATEALIDMVKKQPEKDAVFRAMHADNKVCTVDELGAITAFLLSDASAAITGTNLIADHGMAANLCKYEDLK